MRKVLIFMFVLIPLFLGCEPGRDGWTSWELTVIDHGAVYPTPEVTTTAITSEGKIHYTEEVKSEFGFGDVVATLAEWSADISEEDLSSLNALIVDSNIINQGDIEADDPLCVGGQGMSVHFTSDAGGNEFRISGSSDYICGHDDEAIPEELHELLSLVDDLVEKYGF